MEAGEDDEMRSSALAGRIFSVTAPLSLFNSLPLLWLGPKRETAWDRDGPATLVSPPCGGSSGRGDVRCSTG